MRPQISIALATYNGSKFLRKQLNSIYSQTRLPDEVVVCDDCSKDDTVSILEEYNEKYGLKYYLNEKNHGVNYSFYRAISLCSCDYVALCDQDDIWLPNKVALTYSKLLEIDDGTPCVVSSQCNHIDADDRIIKQYPDLPDSEGYVNTLVGIGTSQGCTLMMNRKLVDIIIEYKDAPEAQFIYDAFISFTAAIVGKKYNLGTRLMLYRHHENNVVSKFIKKKPTHKQIVLSRWQLNGIMPDERLEVLSGLFRLYDSHIVNESVRKFLKQCNHLYNNNSLTQRVFFILNIEDLRLFEKLKCSIKTIVVSIERAFYI